MPEVHEKQQRIEFRSTRSIEEGEELCFDYGMGYWRNRGWPSNDGRNYSQAEWDRKDAEDALYPGRRFPLPVGTRVPLVPLRPVELQAALTLPDAECRHIAAALPGILWSDAFGAAGGRGGGGR